MIWQEVSPPARGKGRSNGRLRPLVAALLLATAAQLSGQVPGRIEELTAAGREALHQGDAATAAAAFAEAARLAPADAEVFFQLGSAHEHLGEKESATAAFRRAVELDSSHVLARRALVRLGAVGWSPPEILERAELLSLEGRLKEAVYLFQRYLKGQPDSARAILGLARCRERLGETDAARELYRRALDLDPGLEEARSKLEEPTAPASPPAAEPGPVESPAAEPPDPGETRSGGTEGEPPTPSPTDVADVVDVVDEIAAAEAEVTDVVAVAEAEAAADSAEAGGDGPEPVPPSDRVAPPVPAEDPKSRAQPAGARVSRRSLVAVLALAIPAATLAFLVLLRHRRRSCSIRGRLDHFPLPDALQLLDAGRKEGVLEIAAGGGGWIWLERGQIVAAESGSDSGWKALFTVLSASAGTFAFYEKPLPDGLERSLELSVQEALLQWAESVDDGNRDRSPDGDLEGLSLEEIEDQVLNVELPF